MNLFPQQQQKMVAMNPAPPARGHIGKSPQGGNTTNANVYMCDQEVNIRLELIIMISY
jgi:hypothetical protein